MFAVKPKVLVVDDDLLALELYSRELSEQYQVSTSESIDETRQVLQQTQIDVLVIEPAVNQGEGWKLLNEIHTSPHPPLVVLCSVEDDRKVGIERGAEAFVVKPVLPSALHALLDQLLARRLPLFSQRLEKAT